MPRSQIIMKTYKPYYMALVFLYNSVNFLYYLLTLGFQSTGQRQQEILTQNSKVLLMKNSNKCCLLKHYAFFYCPYL